MPKKHILLILSSQEASQQLEQQILAPAGFRVTRLENWETVESLIRTDPPDMVVVSDKINGGDALEPAALLAQNNPLIPVLLLPDNHSDKLALTAFQQGLAGYIPSFCRREQNQRVGPDRPAAPPADGGLCSPAGQP